MYTMCSKNIPHDLSRILKLSTHLSEILNMREIVSFKNRKRFYLSSHMHLLISKQNVVAQ